MRSAFTMSVCTLAVLGLLGPRGGAAEKQRSGRRGTVRVLLPPGAQWTVNGKAPKNPKKRRFVTPPLAEVAQLVGPTPLNRRENAG
jgi:hypothetical protein